MRAALALALCASLAGCVAETVERRRPRRGPVKEVGFVDAGGGHVRYSAEGWPLIVASRRRTALRLMRRNCGKELVPSVVDEYARNDADAAYAGEDVAASLAHGGDHFRIERYVHIAYECRPKGAPPEPPAPARPPALVVPPVEAPAPVPPPEQTFPEESR